MSASVTMPSRQYSVADPELWGGLDEFPSYHISTFGKVLNHNTGKLLKPQSYSMNFSQKINLRTVDSRTITKQVHRLVAETFLSNYRHNRHVHFIDGDLHNTHLLNLEVSTTGLGQFLGGSETVAIRKLMSSEGIWYGTAREAAEDMGCHVSEIRDCLSGRRSYIRGVEFFYEWEEGTFDGDRFTPWADNGTVPDTQWLNSGW